MRRFMVCSFSDCFTGRIQQSRREEQEAKKQENKVNFRRRTWRFLKQNHISLSMFSFKLPRINFFLSAMILHPIIGGFTLSSC